MVCKNVKRMSSFFMGLTVNRRGVMMEEAITDRLYKTLAAAKRAEDRCLILGGLSSNPKHKSYPLTA